jgi:hypothetical protein
MAGAKSQETTARWTAGAAALGLALASCGELPGTTLGTYDANGKITANTCGLGIGAPNPWPFSVLLSETRGTLFWSWQDASPLLSGPIANGHATLTAYEVDNADTKDGGIQGPCDLERNDDLVLTMGAGSPPASFTASLSYTFSTQVGTDCSDQLSSAGGMYAMLPCSVSYSISAARDP